jgi:hypothetical protein
VKEAVEMVYPERGETVQKFYRERKKLTKRPNFKK